MAVQRSLGWAAVKMSGQMTGKVQSNAHYKEIILPNTIEDETARNRPTIS